MADIGSNIVGTFNQANLASRASEAEKNRARRAEDQRLRDLHRRFVAAQEEVEQTETLRGMRVDPDKEQSAGQDARDQYESHEQLSQDRQKTPDRRPPQRQADDEGSAKSKLPPPEGASGHLIDIKA